MSRTTNRFVLGDHNAACFECGRKKKASTLRKHWKGYYVCPDHWEPRHPQDFAGASADTDKPAFVQHMPEDQFVPDAPNVPIPNPGDYPIND